MELEFNIWKTNREIYLKFLEKLSLDQLNKIPEGFKNNIVWNIGHIIIAQQGLVYRLSNQPMHISKELYDTYRNGSFPTGKTTQEEVNELKELLFSLIEKTKADFNAGLFTEFHPYQTQTGFGLSSLEEAITFNNYHEGLHLGVIMSLRKHVK